MAFLCTQSLLCHRSDPIIYGFGQVSELKHFKLYPKSPSALWDQIFCGEILKKAHRTPFTYQTVPGNVPRFFAPKWTAKASVPN